jgi:DNA-binding MarR family transcriptional regulator
MADTPPDHLDRILAQWRRERPELDVAPLGLVGRLFRSTHLADKVLAETLSQHGLQAGWFDLLAALRRAGAPYELNPTQLMQATMLSSGGMTKRLDRLVEAGLVERRPDPADRRGTLVGLTRRGKAIVNGAIDPHLENQKRLLGALTPAERRALDDLLRKLLASLERSETSSEAATAR